MGNSFGQLFRITTWGESDGGGVAAGGVARKVLSHLFAGFELIAYVTDVYDVSAAINCAEVTRERVEATPIRCPDAEAAQKMIAAIEKARGEGDSLGGTIACVARALAAGVGGPVVDVLEAGLAQAMLSLPASKGFEIGSG